MSFYDGLFFWEKGGNGMWSSRDKDEDKRIAFSFDIVALIM